jgi:hypothetical protein
MMLISDPVSNITENGESGLDGMLMVNVQMGACEDSE